MTLLLIGLGLMVASGVLSLVVRRAGVTGAIAGCVVAMIPAVQILAGGRTEAMHLPWSVPYGSFAVALDPLSALFLIPILTLSALAALYGEGYLEHVRHKKSLGATWFFTNLLIASALLAFSQQARIVIGD